MRCEREFEILNEKGLHARASALFAEIAERFESDIVVKRDSISVSASSLMGLLLLTAAQGCRIQVVADGPDADQAIAAIGELIADRFGESE